MSASAHRVLFALPNGGRGGMQVQVALIASALAAQGVPTAVAVGGGGVDAIGDVDVVEVASFSAAWPLPYLRGLRAAAARHRATVVHGHGLRLAPLVARSGVSSRFVTCHGLDPRQAARTLRRVGRSHVRFVACGEGPRAILASQGVDATVIDNAIGEAPEPVDPVALRTELGLVGTVPLVVYPARFSEQKNHVSLIRALATVREGLGERSPEVLCVGDGPLFAATKRLAESVDGRPLARCLGFQPAARRWLAASTFFVLPSLWEGQPQVVLEAMSAGLPVVSTTPTGLEGLIVEGRNGRLVADESALADVIAEWSESPSTMPGDWAINRQVLAQHSVERVVERYLALYAARSS